MSDLLPNPRLLRRWVEDNHVRTPTYLPGAVLLRRWLDDSGTNAHRFALQYQLDESELSKILRGRRGAVGVPFAIAIEDATKGAIPVRSWIPKELDPSNYS